jgi:hypothetical protein
MAARSFFGFPSLEASTQAGTGRRQFPFLNSQTTRRRFDARGGLQCRCPQVRLGHFSGEYLTKEAALEAAVSAASNAVKKGYAVTIKVDGSESNEPALGAD